MVELYSLKLLGDLTGVDQDVAQLEFESSLIDQSLNLGLDPTLISTDSLDMEKIHLRCETNKNDYKITFEDSGQWTTSGIANSPDEEATETAAANLTTWGRIRSTEPFDEKTNSLPELARKNLLSPTAAPKQPQRPASLVANFVEKQPDYEYSDSGRVLDVNDNEIGFVPESTAPFQKIRKTKQTTPLKPPRRTFADLETPIPRDDSGIERTPLTEVAPDLKFLSLPFEVPTFCQQPSSVQIPSLEELLRQTKQSHLTEIDDKYFESKMAEFASPDSGLGSATSSSGPSHIEDWPSLAFLLPKHVVEACSFFKSNSHLLTGSSPSEKQNSLLTSPNRPTTSGVPRSSSHQKCCHFSKDASADSGIAASRLRKPICDCQTRSLIVGNLNSNPHSKLCLNSKLKLHAKELSIIGLPIYNEKRSIVEKVVEGIAEIVRGAPTNVLVVALEGLLCDGLNSGLTCWDMIEAVTAPGPATSNVYQLMKDLEVSEKPKNSRSQYFFKELLRLRSLDGWLSYVMLKENVLSRLYNKDAFMVKANSAYRSLFWRLIESLELLSVMEQRPKRRDRGDSGVGADCSTWTWGSASKIASDSRVPKSSSVPSKLVAETVTVENKEEPKIERPGTLNIQVPRTPSPRPYTPNTATSSSRISTPSPSQLSINSSTTSMRKSRIPIPNSNSPLNSTITSRIRTPSIINIGKNLTTNTLLNTTTRLPLYRHTQYGTRAISQQRPLTTNTCRFESRRPTTTTTTNVNRSRKYY